jgi:hypothetical protein
VISGQQIRTIERIETGAEISGISGRPLDHRESRVEAEGIEFTDDEGGARRAAASKEAQGEMSTSGLHKARAFNGTSRAFGVGNRGANRAQQLPPISDWPRPYSRLVGAISFAALAGRCRWRLAFPHGTEPPSARTQASCRAYCHVDLPRLRNLLRSVVARRCHLHSDLSATAGPWSGSSSNAPFARLEIRTAENP